MNRDDCDTFDAPGLVLGLLSEAECRAAGMLAKRGIDQQRVLARWPCLKRRDDAPATPAGPFSRDVASSLQAAEIRLAEYPQPLALATEHILLGLVAAAGETADWLADHGFDADTLEAEIHRLYGHTPGPLEFDASWAGGDSIAASGRTSRSDTDLPGSLRRAAIADSLAPIRGTTPPSDTNVDSAAGTAPDTTGAASTPKPAVAESGDETSLYRIIDAAANRGREAFRVVEDYLRFALDDAHLTEVCKQLRHRLTAILAKVPAELRYVSRETSTDVGTGISTKEEFVRADVADVLAANFKRLEESLRSLEEYGKINHAPLAAELEQLRYQVYTLERVAAITGESLERLRQTRLYVLLDGRESGAEFARLAAELIAAGVDAIQLRDKTLSDRELLGRARELRDLTRGASTLMIINDRPDVAAVSGADGIHLGQDELSVKDARRIVGPRALIGISTHSLEQARRAVLDGANYIGVGPMFRSDTKSFDHFPGTQLLKAVAAEIRLPAFAIGGINLENVDQVLASGICRIAVSAAITSSPDPADAARRFLDRLQG